MVPGGFVSVFDSAFASLSSLRGSFLSPFVMPSAGLTNWGFKSLGIFGSLPSFAIGGLKAFTNFGKDFFRVTFLVKDTGTSVLAEDLLRVKPGFWGCGWFSGCKPSPDGSFLPDPSELEANSSLPFPGSRPNELPAVFFFTFLFVPFFRLPESFSLSRPFPPLSGHGPSALVLSPVGLSRSLVLLKASSRWFSMESPRLDVLGKTELSLFTSSCTAMSGGSFSILAATFFFFRLLCTHAVRFFCVFSKVLKLMTLASAFSCCLFLEEFSKRLILELSSLLFLAFFPPRTSSGFFLFLTTFAPELFDSTNALGLVALLSFSHMVSSEYILLFKVLGAGASQ